VVGGEDARAYAGLACGGVVVGEDADAYARLVCVCDCGSCFFLYFNFFAFS